ncbi:undecaprenyl-diphosphatase [Fontibacillus phaseoli]|uniref:Undecaprenyl-diphosphatase n=1 Tax=Fontibacillus phaseoli TaxID=1416533 RepID=A0A369B8V4_9BACL|nr:phosphatase PAP2 family protein [Fontibacillus phaseoli]RCX16967.1 undecaprenyl-diphosphatase [Fontibacillus phaseoli]
MKSSRSMPITAITGLICAVAFTVIAVAVQSGQISQFDRTLIDAVQGREAPGLTGVMEFFTSIGNGTSVALITLIAMTFLYGVLGHRRELLLLCCTMLGSAILNSLLKICFIRERPTFHRLIEVTGYSFPSGHSMVAFCLYGTLAYLLWRHLPGRKRRFILILLSLMFIVTIGLSRIYLGVHYPSDVLGAYFAGGFWLSCSIWLYKRFIVQ